MNKEIETQQKQKSMDDFWSNVMREVIQPKEKIIEDIAGKLYDKQFLYMITELNMEQLNLFYKMIIMDRMFYKKYCEDKELFDEFSDLFNILLELMISKNRKGRRELIEMFTETKIQLEKQDAMKRRFFGLR